MASTKTLNVVNLAALGAERLADLLLEVSSGNPAIKRRLRLELAGEQSPAEAAREIRKRLSTIARSRTFVDWQNRRALVDDLEGQRRAIVDKVAKVQPTEGLELLWRFLDLAESVFNRCDDSSGTVAGVFRAAVSDLENIAPRAAMEPEELASRTFLALTQNDYGQYDGLIPALTAALGKTGLEHLKRKVIAHSREDHNPSSTGKRQVVGYSTSGPIYADDLAARARDIMVRTSLQAIADAQGDVDAFIGQYSTQIRKRPKIAAEIAARLLGAGRPAEALQAIESAEQRPGGWPDFDWEDVRIETLDALGRPEAAQAARWSCFERSLSASHLRAYLKKLPDFEDVDAEERALAYAEGVNSFLTALSFLVSWPALDRAANLVVRRAAELDGDHYETLTPAAHALAGKYPLAATLVLRSMIDFALTRSRVKRYRHAARHLSDCAGLAPLIKEIGSFEPHDAYVERLRKENGRKSAFWAYVA